MNRSAKVKKFKINDRFATDAAGVMAFEKLKESLDRRHELGKRERYYAFLNLLRELKGEKRLWNVVDGSLIE